MGSQSGRTSCSVGETSPPAVIPAHPEAELGGAAGRAAGVAARSSAW